jgi:hypothetical protein
MVSTRRSDLRHSASVNGKVQHGQVRLHREDEPDRIERKLGWTSHAQAAGGPYELENHNPFESGQYTNSPQEKERGWVNRGTQLQRDDSISGDTDRIPLKPRSFSQMV